MDKEKLLFIEDVLVCMTPFNIPLDVRYFIACQFALESSFGASSLSKNNENYCGMKNPMVRISTAIHSGDSNYHWAQYRCMYDCVYDFFLCLQYHRPLSCDYDTVEHYMSFISKFYCPERDYCDRIYKIYVQFKSQKNG